MLTNSNYLIKKYYMILKKTELNFRVLTIHTTQDIARRIE